MRQISNKNTFFSLASVGSGQIRHIVLKFAVGYLTMRLVQKNLFVEWPVEACGWDRQYFWKNKGLAKPFFFTDGTATDLVPFHLNFSSFHRP